MLTINIIYSIFKIPRTSMNSLLHTPLNRLLPCCLGGYIPVHNVHGRSRQQLSSRNPFLKFLISSKGLTFLITTIILFILFIAFLFFGELNTLFAPHIRMQRLQRWIASEPPLDLVRLKRSEADQYGAYCLDGSEPAYYIRRAHEHAKNAKTWVIALGRGTWCWDEEDCYLRSKTVKGSTKELPQRIRLQGVLSSSSEVNPHLHDANAVYIHYCDGGMFAGARDDPVFVKTAKDKDTEAEPAKVPHRVAGNVNAGGQKNAAPEKRFIHMRGYFILKAVIQHLTSSTDILRTAQNILFVGLQASGMGLLLHLGELRDMFPGHIAVAAVLDGAFILGDLPNRFGDESIGPAFKALFDMQHVVRTEAASECARVLALTEDTYWKCLLPAFSYRYFTRLRAPAAGAVPVLFVQSSYDRIGRELVMQADCAIASACEGDESTLAAIHFYRRQLERTISVLIQTAPRRRDAVFLPSCVLETHVDRDLPFTTLAVDRITLRDALMSWYHYTPVSPIAAADVPSLALNRLAPAEEDPPTGITPNWNLQANVILNEVLMRGAHKSATSKPSALRGDAQQPEEMGVGGGKEKGKTTSGKEVKWLRPMLVDSWYPSNPTCQHIERVLGLRAAHD